MSNFYASLQAVLKDTDQLASSIHQFDGIQQTEQVDWEDQKIQTAIAHKKLLNYRNTVNTQVSRQDGMVAFVKRKLLASSEQQSQGSGGDGGDGGVGGGGDGGDGGGPSVQKLSQKAATWATLRQSLEPPAVSSSETQKRRTELGKARMQLELMRSGLVRLEKNLNEMEDTERIRLRVNGDCFLLMDDLDVLHANLDEATNFCNANPM